VEIKGVEFTWTTEFKSKDLQDYRSRTRPRTIDYSIYASDRMDDQYMRDLTGLFRKYAQPIPKIPVRTISLTVRACSNTIPQKYRGDSQRLRQANPEILVTFKSVYMGLQRELRQPALPRIGLGPFAE